VERAVFAFSPAWHAIAINNKNNLLSIFLVTIVAILDSQQPRSASNITMAASGRNFASMAVAIATVFTVVLAIVAIVAVTVAIAIAFAIVVAITISSGATFS
jgi:hypothetical protein